jgi:hypothetical protein
MRRSRAPHLAQYEHLFATVGTYTRGTCSRHRQLIQARLSWASDRSRMVEIRHDLMIDLLALVVELERAQRVT